MIKTFAHAGNAGDVIAALPALRAFYRKTGTKPILYLIRNHPAEYYEGAVHPVKDENGNTVNLNDEMIALLTPLLKQQEYIEDVRVCGVEFGEWDVALSEIRNTFCNIPFHDLRRWYFYVYPDLACDLSEQYLFVPDSEKNFTKDKIIIARSERYHSGHVDNDNEGYSFLKKYEDNLVFSGTMREHNKFCMDYDLNIPKLSINNFLELAQALKQSNGLVSNQTMIFQIAEGLKIPRVVELCSFAPNVIPTGENAFDFHHVVHLKYYFHLLNGTIPEYVKEIEKAGIIQPQKVVEDV